MKAIWGVDYDHVTDKVYGRPCCPKCEAPIGKEASGEYRCFSCGRVVEVTDLVMLGWLRARDDTKVETGTCVRCGNATMVTHYVRNPVTLDWQTAMGACQTCGARFIV